MGVPTHSPAALAERGLEKWVLLASRGRCVGRTTSFGGAERSSLARFRSVAFEYAAALFFALTTPNKVGAVYGNRSGSSSAQGLGGKFDSPIAGATKAVSEPRPSRTIGT